VPPAADLNLQNNNAPSRGFGVPSEGDKPTPFNTEEIPKPAAP
jgi:hypothetical protein